MNKSIEQQLSAINSIMKTDDKGKKLKPKSYALKGKTFMLKDDLKAWGWQWDYENKHWALDEVYEDDPSLRIVSNIPETWLEVVK